MNSLLKKIKNIKEDFGKIESLKNQIRDLKSYEDLIATPIFLTLCIPMVYKIFSLFFEMDSIFASILFCILFSFIGLIISALLSLGVYKIIQFFWNIKNRKTLNLINNINGEVLSKGDIYNSKKLEKILLENDRLSEDTKYCKDSYFNYDCFDEKHLMYRMIRSYFFKSSKLTFEIFCDYLKAMDKHANNSDFKLFFLEASLELIKWSSEEDFFLNKNSLMDLVTKNLDKVTDRKTVIEAIRAKISHYNNQKQEEKDVNEDILELKKEISNKERKNKIVLIKEKNLIIKSI